VPGNAANGCRDVGFAVMDVDFPMIRNLPNDTVSQNGVVLHRIKRIADGALGGYVQSEANLDQAGSCWLLDQSRAYGTATIKDNAQVSGTVYDSAAVSGSAVVTGRVFGQGKVMDNAVSREQVYDNATVKVFGTIYGEAHCNAVVEDHAIVFGTIYGDAVAKGHEIVFGSKH
jgi:hypothetical protein